MNFNAETRPVAGLECRANVLLTGASSGIGHALLKELLENKHVARVFAVSRSATTSSVLAELQKHHGMRLQCIDADITNEGDLARLAETTNVVDGLHLVINAAGLLHGGSLGPEKSITQASFSNFERVFAINAFAPLLLAKVLLPQLCRGQPAVFTSLSARVGSIGDNRSG